MRKLTTGLLAITFIAGMGAFAWKACATDEPAKATDDKASAGTAAAGDAGTPAATPAPDALDLLAFLGYDLHAATRFSKTSIGSGSNMRPILAHPSSASVWETPH